MINYFYNITSKEDGLNFYTDVLTNIRKDFYLTKEKIKGKITQNSSLNSVYYEYALEKNKPLKWKVSDDSHISSDCKNLDDGKYCVSFYNETGLFKQITFSKLHTLLKVEYFNTTKSTSPYFIIEPRKSNNGLCLLMNVVGSFQSVVLFPMPAIDDDYISDKVDSDFTDYCAVASTNDGVVKFLDSMQLEKFEEFIDRAQAMKLTDERPESFIDESDAVLAKKFNPKDFNVKKNLSEIIDITDAQEFSYNEDDTFEQMMFEVDDTVSDSAVVMDQVEDACEPEFTQVDDKKQCDENVENFDEPFVSSFVEYTQADLDAINSPVSDTEDTETIDPTSEVLGNNFDEKSDELIAFDDSTDVCDETYIEEKEILAETKPEKPVDEPIIIETTIDTDSDDNSDMCDCEMEFVLGEASKADRVVESANAKYYYYGELDDQNNRTGFGRTATENGHTAYEGLYSANKRNGSGAYYYKDGKLCYYGNWKDNKRDGFGIGVSSLDDSVHVGHFTDNKPFGDGVRIDSNGSVKFIQKTLSDGISVVLKFDGDKIIVVKYNDNGEIISENSSNLKYF